MYSKMPTAEEVAAGFCLGEIPGTKQTGEDDFVSMVGGPSLENLPNGLGVFRLLPDNQIIIKMEIPGTSEIEYTRFEWESDGWAPRQQFSLLQTVINSFPFKKK